MAGSDPSVDPSVDPFRLRSLDIGELRGRGGVKWQLHQASYAAWVADMDFPVAPPIAEALRSVIDRNEFGYPNWGRPPAVSPAARLFPQRMAERWGWECDPSRVRDLADVLQGVRAAVLHLSAPGDGIVLHLPAYYPFLDTIEVMGRRLVPVHFDPVTRNFDYDRLAADLAASPARLWILCHPQNPLGHVFERSELERIADLATAHDLVVISDEIHSDLLMPGSGHVPFESLGPQVAARTVTITSASKAFNLAGLRWAVMHAGHEPLHRALAALPDHYLGAPNVMAVTAAVAAWTAGDPWLRAVLDVVDENRRSLVDLLGAHLPGAVYTPPSATYLAWVDCRPAGLGDDPAAVFRTRGVEVSPGSQFGSPGVGHVRINLATSPAILAAMVAALAE
ncbi:MAG: MalY/PatB family protein [Ilumatobacteraceae bacterium]